MPKFVVPRLVETNYQTLMAKLVKTYLPATRSNAWDTWLDDLWAMAASPEYRRLAFRLATRMVTNVNVQNVKTWRERASRSSQPQKLYRLLQQELDGEIGMRFNQIVAANAELITSIPAEVATSLAAEIARGEQQGIRPETIGKALRERFPELTKGRILTIARTQVSMASSSLTEVRATALGLPFFEWNSSEDQRVRPSHRKMDGVLSSWNDLPSPEALVGIKSSLGRYGPGQAPNCRCFPGVLLSLDDVSWPRRLYSAGSLKTVTRAQFQRFSNLSDRIAA